MMAQENSEEIFLKISVLWDLPVRIFQFFNHKVQVIPKSQKKV